ncbi:MAG: class I SAM-dependent methyltransferase [Planctomycetes bacterium]|nr:class I SAM-dependent methyltransferase [Planctomycetota bacterium]
MNSTARKHVGAYYTPDDTAASLVRWGVRRVTDRLLDPACGDGQFLALHQHCVGVEQDPGALAAAMRRAPWAQVHRCDFFTWAARTEERFECAAGNPPFIRYQRFTGDVRRSALRLCERLGVRFSALTSSWAPFLVAVGGLLKPGGRMAFVVPAEIGHAPYAVPLLSHLLDRFATVQVIAVREKIFADLSEDCWLLYADGRGGRSDEFRLTVLERFDFATYPPQTWVTVTRREWTDWNHRLRPFVLPPSIRTLYRESASGAGALRLGEVASVGIGYVTGANDFFHLRPSAARLLRIPDRLLHVSVRNSSFLATASVTDGTVRGWLDRDEPVLLLRIEKDTPLTSAVRDYLSTPQAREASATYKCRHREPWYVVPDVFVPDGFLSYMSGVKPLLVSNPAGCVCTNSVHAVVLKKPFSMRGVQRLWDDPFTTLSCELEGHPLGGGLLKVEPREAGRIVLVPPAKRTARQRKLILEGIEIMRRWRHCEQSA